MCIRDRTVELDPRCRFVDATSRQTWQWVVANSDELAGPPAPPGLKGDAQFALVTAGERYLVAFPRSGVDAGKHTTGDEVMQLRALQLSDQCAPAVQRATRPLAKSVQIVGAVSYTHLRAHETPEHLV